MADDEDQRGPDDEPSGSGRNLGDSDGGETAHGDSDGGESGHGDSDGDDSSGISIDRRKALLGGLLAVLLAGGAFTAISQLTQSGKLHEAVTHSAKLWLIPCLAGQLITYAGYQFAYHAAARASGGPRFDYRTTLRIVIFGAGLSIIGASVGGLAVDFWALRRTGTAPVVATRRVLAVGTLEWTVLSAYAWTCAALALILVAHPPLTMAVGWLVVVPLCVAGALWFTHPPRVERYIDPPPMPDPGDGGRLRRAIHEAHRRLRNGLGNGISGVLLVRHLLSHPIRYYGAAIGYPIYWAGDMLTLYAAVRMFGFAPNPILLVLAYATGFVVSALPLPAGGAGGVDATIAFALQAGGVPLPQALLGVFVYRIITFWLPVIPSLALLPSIRRLHDRLPSIPHTKPDADESPPFRPQAEHATGQ